MQLSRRLEMVANLVTKGNRVADIGCDHAYTSIYLVKEKIAPYVLAMDVNQGPLKKAKANIAAYRMTEQIETRLSNGAEKLNCGEVETVLLSGMGGLLMIRILSEKKEIVDELNELILQPQSEITLVRHFLHDQGFSIEREEMLKEDGKYYIAIKAVRGKEVYDKEVYYQFGKELLIRKDSTLKEFLNKEKTMRMNIVKSLQEKDTEQAKKRLEELEHELQLIEEAYQFF